MGSPVCPDGVCLEPCQIQAKPRFGLLASLLGIFVAALLFVPLPASAASSIEGISCITSSNCTGVGNTDASGSSQISAVKWNGTTWSKQTMPTVSGASTSSLAAVSCPGTECLAVGNSTDSGGAEHALGTRWNGSSWLTPTVPEPAGATASQASAVSCVFSTSCIAVGTYTDSGGTKRPLSARWNGSAWTILTTPNVSEAKAGSLYGISCFSTTYCIAVGSYVTAAGVTSNLSLKWNGTTWSVLSTPNPASFSSSVLSAVHCVAKTACTAVGRYVDSGTTKTLAMQWNETSWTIQPTTDPNGSVSAELSGVSCPSTSVCLAIGSQKNAGGDTLPLGFKWNGKSWGQQVIEADELGALTAPLNGISCVSTSACHAAGSIAYGATTKERNLAYRWDGGSWALTESGGYQRTWDEVPLSPPTETIDAAEPSDVACVSTTCIRVGSVKDGSGKYFARAKIWNGSYWTLTPAPPKPSGAKESELVGVACTAANACRAVGSFIDSGGVKKTLAMVWNGTSWSQATTPNPAGGTQNQLSAISCTSVSDCRAVGSYVLGGIKKTLAMSWNGTAWSIAASPNLGSSTQLNGISCVSTTFCRAVGNWNEGSTTKSLVLGWNGTAWATTVPLHPAEAKSSRLIDVSCPSTTFCLAVGMFVDASGTQQGLAYRSTGGTTWVQAQSALGTPGKGVELKSVACPSAALCRAAGNYLPTTGPRKSVFATWTENFTLDKWELYYPLSLKESTKAEQAGIACVSTTSCTSVGTDSQENGPLQEIAYSYNGSGWNTIDYPGSSTELNDTSCTTADACIAVGKRTSAYGSESRAWRKNGSTWSLMSMPSVAGSYLTGVSCSDSTKCTAVGGQGTSTSPPLAQRWNGSSWSNQTAPAPGGSPTDISFKSVACPTATLCIAVGQYYTSGSKFNMLSEIWNGTSWSIQTLPLPAGATQHLLEDISCSSSTFCIAVGAYRKADNRFWPFIEHWNGTQWQVTTPPEPAEAEQTDLTAVSCTSSTACTVVGSYWKAMNNRDSYVGRWDGNSWKIQASANPDGAKTTVPSDVSCAGAKRCVSVGASNPSGGFNPFVMGWDGFNWVWEPVSNPSWSTLTTFSGVSCPYTGDCVAVGEGDSVAGNKELIEKSLEPTEQKGSPPETTITSPMPSYTSTIYKSGAPANIWVTFASSKPNSTFECKLDGKPYGEPYTPCTSPYLMPTPSAGWHTFRVRSKDSEGVTDWYPARWDFNTASYPGAPAGTELVSPRSGFKTSSHYTLKARWGVPPANGGGGVTGVTYQVALPNTSPFFKTIPANFVVGADGKQVQWPLPVGKESPGESEPAYFDADAYLADLKISTEFPVPMKFRAVFDGGQKAAGVTEPSSTEYDELWSSPMNATEQIGPANLDLLSGRFTISRTDVSIPVPGYESNLEFTRVYDSSYVGQAGTSKVLGGPWQPSLPMEAAYPGQAWAHLVEEHEDAWPAEYDEEGELIEEGYPAEDWVELYDNEGTASEFELINGQYVSPDHMTEYSLKKSGETFVLTDKDGNKTYFAKNAVGPVNEYRVTAVEFKSAPNMARLIYENTGQEYRLTMIIAPSAAGVTCEPNGPFYAPTTSGCRSLTFQYTLSPEHYTYDRLYSLTYFGPTGSGTGQVVARYGYDSNKMLSEVWDPRITPNLKETYAYQSYDIEKLTIPGEETWTLGYYPGQYVKKLKSVSRPSLIPATPVAQTTIAYEVPLSGSSAPYEMGAETVRQWGQKDYPLNATAIFPPDEVPASPPTSYSRATVKYLDADGQLVNIASPQNPGASGPSISTNEVDEHANVVRSLSAQARLEALADPNPALRSQELDTRRLFSADGTEMQEEWGPVHTVRLESGSTVEARQHKTVLYDEGAPAEVLNSGMKPSLPTTTKIGAQVPGQAQDLDVRVRKTEYNWTLLKPTTAIVDPSGLNLRTRTIYDESTGLTTEVRLPANPEGGDARTTKMVYYTAGAHPLDGECGSKPAYANLPCKVLQAAQPTPAGGNPGTPVTRVVSYSALDAATEIEQKTSGEVVRTTKVTYDGAGRQLKESVTGIGASIPTVESIYSSTTGRQVGQRFVCEAPENCTGFDSQETIATMNAIGQEIAYLDADGNTSIMTYDLRGRRATVSDGKGTQTYGYDSNSGLPVQVIDSAAGTFTANYDADGSILERGLPNGLVSRTTYDETGTPVRLLYEKVSSCVSNCTWLDTNVEESIHHQWLRHTRNGSVDEYSYDSAGRVLLTKDKAPSGPCTTRTYSYDANSNRKKLVTRAPGAEGACDTTSTGQTQALEYDTGDRLIGEGVTYDKLGRVTALPSKYSGGGALTTSFYENDLIRAQTQDGLTNTYGLDASLRQSSSTQSGSKTATQILHYSGPSDTPSWIANGAAWTRNISAIDGQLAAIQESSGTTMLQLPDLHGDIVATATLNPNATGFAATYEYDEFGGPKQSSGPRFGWLGAMGRRAELPSGVVQMGVRSYVPAIGRFLSTDPQFGGSANAYEYAMQDPINNLDLDGERVRRKRRGGGGPRAGAANDIMDVIPDPPAALSGACVPSKALGIRIRLFFQLMGAGCVRKVQYVVTNWGQVGAAGFLGAMWCLAVHANPAAKPWGLALSVALAIRWCKGKERYWAFVYMGG